MRNALSIATQTRPTPLFTLAIAMALCAAPAFGQTISAPAITPEMRAAFNEVRPYCKADAAKFCRGTAPGGGRIVNCMLEHIEDLSPTCQQKIQAIIPR